MIKPKSASLVVYQATWRTAKKAEIIKRQLVIFRHVSPDLAERLEKATGIKGYPDITNMRSNGTHNGMAKDDRVRVANGMKGVKLDHNSSNGAPVAGKQEVNGVNGHAANGHANGVSAH
jgi:catalase